ncbi:MAG TPA: prepilin-type N-terminal cleavage/methylation domain-containing protein [Planctomycetota bacterium]|nr:prepilin-type N-terminal cleavage/methylation domain-containing protein [Planctomycetota bacterium]
MVRKGFTLLEVLMVLVVLAIVASIGFGILRFVDGARISATHSRVHELGIQAGTVAGLRGFPPATLEELAPRLGRPEWMKDGRFVDSWDRPIEYRVDGKTFRVWSWGPDGVSGTPDDIAYKNN